MRQDPERDPPSEAARGGTKRVLGHDPSDAASTAGLSDDEAKEGRSRPGTRQAKRSSPGQSRTTRPVARGSVAAIRSEAELNAPDRQTLWMLAVIAGITLVMWGAARAACNHHPPRETRRPRHVSTAELARDPKNAAIEMQQRWATHNFSGALELAAGPIAEQVQKELQACEADADACQQRHDSLKDRVLTTGTLLERGSDSAKVRVTSLDQDKSESFVMDLEQAGAIWKVRSRARAQ